MGPPLTELNKLWLSSFLLFHFLLQSQCKLFDSDSIPFATWLQAIFEISSIQILFSQSFKYFIILLIKHLSDFFPPSGFNFCYLMAVVIDDDDDDGSILSYSFLARILDNNLWSVNCRGKLFERPHIHFKNQIIKFNLMCLNGMMQ